MKKLFCMSAMWIALLPAQQPQSCSWFSISSEMVTRMPDIPYLASASWYLWMAEDLASLQRQAPPTSAGLVPYLREEDSGMEKAVRTGSLFNAREHR